MKFLLDENVPQSLKTFLVLERKFNVTSIQDLNQQGISNGEVANLALKHESVIITFDKDFTFLNINLRKKSKIIYIKIHPRDPVVAKQLLVQHLDQCIDFLKIPAIIELTTKGIQVLD